MPFFDLPVHGENPVPLVHAAARACIAGVGKDDYRTFVVGGQLARVRPGVHGRGRADADRLTERYPDGLGGLVVVIHGHAVSVQRDLPL